MQWDLYELRLYIKSLNKNSMKQDLYVRSLSKVFTKQDFTL